jgi:1A family penicillin-binding protein
LIRPVRSLIRRLPSFRSSGRPVFRAHWRGLSALAVAIVAVIAFDAWLVTCGFAGCPTPTEIRLFHPSMGGQIRDRNDKLIGRLAVVRRLNIKLAEVPDHVQQAFIATEDRRFYTHNGLDWRGLARSVVRNVGNFGVREGFSTITMQVARNSFLRDRYNGRSLRRKLVELRITRLLERELTKPQILEHYLNVIYLGNGVNGVEAASRDLFGKSVGKLTLAEGAVLAGLPKAPSVYTPRRSIPRARTRRDLVLRLMAEQKMVAAGVADAAIKSPLRIVSEEWRPSVAAELSAMDAVRALVDSVLPDALKEGDVVVHTTLDERLQRAADKIVVRQAAAITRETAANYGRVAEPAQGAYVALDPATGDILAVVTGRRTQRGGFNRAFHAKRQPGSAFKPFVYAAAMAAGYKPSTMVDDTPVEVLTGNDVWIPANYNSEYQGRVTLARALMKSSNAATVRVSRALGEPAVINAARLNGITSPLDPVPSIALGAMEVTPVELVAAYAPFANGGYAVTPRLVKRIEAPDGTVLWASDTTPSRAAMTAPDAYEVTTMLRGVVDYGTGRAIRDWGIRAPVAGKTGTTNNGTDVWFVGYTPTLVAGLWFGYDTPRPIAPNASGGRLAVPAWAEIFMGGWRETATQFHPPAGMVPAYIDPEAGQLAGDWCPLRVQEWYKPGSEPTEICTLHLEPVAHVTEHEGGVGGGGGRNDLDRAVDAIRGALDRIFRGKKKKGGGG